MENYGSQVVPHGGQLWKKGDKTVGVIRTADRTTYYREDGETKSCYWLNFLREYELVEAASVSTALVPFEKASPSGITALISGMVEESPRRSAGDSRVSSLVVNNMKA